MLYQTITANHLVAIQKKPPRNEIIDLTSDDPPDTQVEQNTLEKILDKKILDKHHHDSVLTPHFKQCSHLDESKKREVSSENFGRVDR